MDSNLNNQILLIGAGQLGSRHLQGLLKMKNKQLILVLDQSESSLINAKSRANEIDNHHEVVYITNWERIPKSLDLVIVATGADVREYIITYLLEKHVVKNLVLEKILFQDIMAYQKIAALLESNGINTWVNHPRRMFSHYQEIRRQILVDKTELVFHVAGSNWGLGCNSLHFIDLITFLTDSPVASIDMEWIDTILHQSKRQGFVEFTGTVKGQLLNGSKFTITSFVGNPGPITITIANANNRWLIQEGGSPQVTLLSSDAAFKIITKEIVVEFQSSLTTRLAADILESNNCDLPTFKEARMTHEMFLTELLAKYVKLSGITTKFCPIT